MAAWEDSEDYDAWLDYLSKGGTTESWNLLKKRADIIQSYSGKRCKELLEKIDTSAIIKLDNRTVREWYINANNRIHLYYQIPKKKQKDLEFVENQAKKAFLARNRNRIIAREMMEDEEAKKELERKHPNISFEELIEKKMKNKGLTREEAILDIFITAIKTNEAVNKSLGLDGE